MWVSSVTLGRPQLHERDERAGKWSTAARLGLVQINKTSDLEVRGGYWPGLNLTVNWVATETGRPFMV